MRMVSRAEELRRGDEFRRKWIAELEADLAAMGEEDWQPGTADGAKMFAGLAFPGWTPRFERECNIWELRRELGERVGPRPIFKENNRFAGWKPERAEAAMTSVVTTLSMAGVSLG